MTEIINIEKLKEALENSQNILIIIDAEYSFDDLAGGLALGLSLEKLGKKITIFSHKAPIVEEASLFGISKIVNRLSAGNLIISIPNALNSVDKVTHYLDGETLNIIIHPLDSKTELATDAITMRKIENIPDLAIFINTTGSKFLDTLTTQEQKMYSDVRKIIIGRAFSNFEQQTVVSTTNRACLSETVVWLLTQLDLPIDVDCASNLFQGIKFATQFSPPAATAATFQAASICLTKKPVIDQITKEDTEISQKPATQQTASPQIQETSLSDIQDLTRSDILQTPKKTQEPENLGKFSASTQKSSKIKEEWLGPKIFKSSSVKSTKT